MGINRVGCFELEKRKRLRWWTREEKGNDHGMAGGRRNKIESAFERTKKREGNSFFVVWEEPRGERRYDCFKYCHSS
jgi:hypothetical protein